MRSDYGDLWGTDDLEYFSRYDGLKFIRLNALGACCIGASKVFEPGSIEVRSILKVLPNLEIASTGEFLPPAMDGQVQNVTGMSNVLPPADRLYLERFAERVSDAVWKLTPAGTLAAVEAGLSVSDIADFLATRGGIRSSDLPETVRSHFDDVNRRVKSLADGGAAWLIECAEPSLAQLIAHDSRLKRLCMPAGDRHVVVPRGHESAFRRGLKSLGYAVPPGSRALKGVKSEQEPSGSD